MDINGQQQKQEKNQLNRDFEADRQVFLVYTAEKNNREKQITGNEIERTTVDMDYIYLSSKRSSEDRRLLPFISVDVPKYCIPISSSIMPTQLNTSPAGDILLDS